MWICSQALWHMHGSIMGSGKDEKFENILTLFDTWQSMMPPPPKKMFLITVLKRFEVGSSNFVIFSINLWSIKHLYLIPGISSVTIATSLLRSTRDFLKLLSQMFPYDEIFKVFKRKILISEINTLKYLPILTFS